MIKIVISGGSNELVSDIIIKTLQEVGINFKAWSDCSKSEIPGCVRETRQAGSYVVVVALKDGR